MNAYRKDASRGMKMTISTERAAEKPKYDLMAAEILKRCREFYEDPENEKAFREWKEKEKSR